MKIVLLGLNHKTAPIDIRERLAFNAEDVKGSLADFKAKLPDVEFALLSTCNRVELYCGCEKDDALEIDSFIQLLSDSRKIPSDDFREYLYIKSDADAVNHLLTVGSSLDSMVVGEPQIISQVKDCFSIAREANSVGKILSKLFHAAFRTSKDIYSSTTITNRRISVAGVAIELARQLFIDMKTAKVLVIGAGEMGQLLVEHLTHIECSDITVINRTYKRAVAIAEKSNITPAKWEQIDELLLTADIVVASAGVQGYLFEKDNFRDIVRQRDKDTLLIIDIAVPRNFEPAINDIDGVYLYSVDDLAEVVKQNVKLREGEIDQAVEIICENSNEFMEWLNSMEIGPLVGKMKEGFEQIRQNEMAGFFTGEREHAACRETLENVVSRVVNKLLHCVIKNLNAEAKEHGTEHAVRMADHIISQTRQVTENSHSKEDVE